MTVAQMHDLDGKVLQILRGAKEPQTLRQIETQLAAESVEADTFDVRDAIWRLIAERRAEFTPERLVQAAHK